jgi:hypothetical protein
MIRTTRGSQKKRLISIVVVGLDKGAVRTRTRTRTKI